jgi:hypothetical protein
LAVAVAYLTVSVGVNTADSSTEPSVFIWVPTAGEYEKVPGTLATALKAGAPNQEPYATGGGVSQVRMGVVWTTGGFVDGEASDEPPPPPPQPKRKVAREMEQPAIQSTVMDRLSMGRLEMSRPCADLGRE